MDLEQRAKQAWLGVTRYASRLVHDHRLLLGVPEEHWVSVVDDLNSGALCVDRPGSVCLEEKKPCSSCVTRTNLVNLQVRDSQGRYLGHPDFGQEEPEPPNPDAFKHIGATPKESSKGFRGPSFHMHLDHECDYGIKDNPLVESLAMPDPQQGIAIWGSGYQVLPDGRHGPSKSSLGSRESKARYLRLSGHVER